MTYWNPWPIAAAWFLGKEVVESSLNAFFNACIELINYNRSLEIKFGFAILRIIQKDLKVFFRPTFAKELNNSEF